jgi:hypothetical protein
MAGFEAHLRTIRDDLVRSWSVSSAGRGKLAAAAGLAVRFTTWQSLCGDGMGDKAMANLMAGWMACIAGTR